MSVLRRASSLCGVVLLASAVSVGAQASAFRGRLLNALSGEPIPGATVLIDELRREATSTPDGMFSFENVAPGTYHVSVRAQGYTARRQEVVVAAGAAPIDVQVEPELHFEEVVSVSPDARSQFESFQATSVLSGQELTKQLEMSLGDTLQNQPGVAVRSFGPAPARPVIRGLDGDRVLILQDGQRMGDLSGQSGDHGVAINPAAAERIEVVRGPATLLYGANAVGGLVNVITEDIPTKPIHGVQGNATFDGGSAATLASAGGSIKMGNGRFALNAGGGGSHSSDVDTPDGEVANSQSRNGFGNVGLSWTGAKSYFGGSYGYDDTRYGIPVVEGGNVELTPRRHAFSMRAGGANLDGAFDSLRATLAVRRYSHDELDGGDVATSFTNNTAEVEFIGSHRPVGRFRGSVGGWFLDRGFDAVGEETLSPAVDQHAIAGFIYEEVKWSHVTLQAGGRIDHTRYAPTGEPERSFTSGSASVGLLFQPAKTRDRLTLAISAARAARSPALEELFYYGPHSGNFAFEIGNPELRPEHAIGLDVSLRWSTPKASGEITYFRNYIQDYIFRAPLTEDAFAAREDEFAERFPDRDLSSPEEGDAGLPIVEYVAADSVLQGVEAHSDFQILSVLFAEAGMDYVRGTLTDSDEPLPRIPPLRFRGGLRYQRNALQIGGEMTFAAAQDRVFPTETTTDGYQLLRAYAAYTFGSGEMAQTLTLRVDNATNELYRNHLSLIKDFVPEMGRNVKLTYNVKF